MLSAVATLPRQCGQHQHDRLPAPLGPFQVLKDVPLYVVTEEKIGLLGTREEAIRLAEAVVAELQIAT